MWNTLWEWWKTRAVGAQLRLGLLALAIIAVPLWFRFAAPVDKPYSPTAGPVTVAPAPKAAVKVRTVTVSGPERIVYLDRVQLTQSLKWFPSLTDNVISVAELPAKGDSGKTTVVATLVPDSDNTFHGVIQYREEPAPFFKAKRDFSLQGRYLLIGTNKMEADLTLKPFRIGPVDTVAGAGIELNRADAGVGLRTYVGFEWRF